MDFKSGQQLIGLCETNECPISEIMLIREETFTERTRKDIINQMGKTWQIMKESAHSSVENPKHSIGGLIGGEAKLLSEHLSSGKSICKDPLSRAITYSMSILETSASMGLIVAAPTAGSAGIVPGLLLALQETYDFSDNDIIRVLFNAGAVGCLAMRNATVAGAVGGCQAEVGVASAMAASAAVELMQGTARQCLDAASTVLMNMLGLVCDPVGGLVECPCQMRNASGVANALTAAEIVLSGVRQLIPFDEMLDAMYTAGKRLPAEYRETALGGCAATSTGCSLCPWAENILQRADRLFLRMTGPDFRISIFQSAARRNLTNSFDLRVHKINALHRVKRKYIKLFSDCQLFRFMHQRRPFYRICFGIRSSDKFIILFIFDPTAIIRTIRQKHRKICVWIRKVLRPVHPAQIKITGMTHTVICL